MWAVSFFVLMIEMYHTNVKLWLTRNLSFLQPIAPPTAPSQNAVSISFFPSRVRYSYRQLPTVKIQWGVQCCASPNDSDGTVL